VIRKPFLIPVSFHLPEGTSLILTPPSNCIPTSSL
jgi:hypothetical protein